MNKALELFEKLGFWNMACVKISANNQYINMRYIMDNIIE